jgi:hypothetical protein
MNVAKRGAILATWSIVGQRRICDSEELLKWISEAEELANITFTLITYSTKPQYLSLDMGQEELMSQAEDVADQVTSSFHS